MSQGTVVVYKGRTNIIQGNLGMDLTGSVITCQIRELPERSSTLIATWTVAITNAVAGDFKLTLDDTVTSTITQKAGYMDMKRVSGGEPLPVFDKPLEVEFRESVTT